MKVTEVCEDGNTRTFFKTFVVHEYQLDAHGKWIYQLKQANDLTGALYQKGDWFLETALA